ncbi:glycosyltransferase family 1 protein [Ornithinimicrobium humiphilum]|uniref:D-inositol 3-phosphate glycosyltransferase n=1 Tax=Ornithinimicrobium humiphilum TaxID=125288 RepID=A0A543KRM2_9MICO|nr:glycosyltransferase family 1 protein [Ornithinimicrobium humiphilum]TQM97727.1 glycosyltransferase involved in cell wall biosynthesis [Ornithinimicrobium humiphilum]
MRVALFTEVFLPKVDGVVTRVTRTLDQLAELGHEALVFAPGDPPERYGPHRVVRVRSVSFRPWYPEIMVGLPTPRIAREMQAFRPDVVHAVNPVWLAAYGVLSARRRNLPLLASFHTDVPSYTTAIGGGLQVLRRPVQGWTTGLHNLAEVNLCTSGQMVDRARAVGIREVDLWPKAVDTTAYHPGAGTAEMRDRLTDGHPEAPLVLYVGRLSREKDLDQLLEPIRRLAPRGVRLALVGSGPGREELERAFAGTPTVFAGYLGGADLAAAYASADVFAFPSTTETLGLVALESMASGVPVVGADAGGIPFVVDDGRTGFLVPPGDADVLTERLGRLLDDAGLRGRMGRAAREDALSHSWRAATEALVGFYELAVERHAGRSPLPRPLRARRP